MTTMVKICGLTDRNAVDTAVDAGADAVGFVFATSPRQVSPANAAELASGLPAGIKKVAVMRHPADGDWQAVLATFRPDVLQTDAEDFAGLTVPDHVERWPVYREGDVDLSTALPEVYLYEGQSSGTGEPVDWRRAAEFAGNGRMILAGGLAADNVAAAIAAVKPWGVDVSSGVEAEKGVKDPQKIRDFLSAVRSAAR